jgi:hypothetical protein
MEVVKTSTHLTPAQSERSMTSLEMTPQTAARAYYAPSDERLRLQDAEVNPFNLISIINLHLPFLLGGKTLR